jgi:hypothetical protein
VFGLVYCISHRAGRVELCGHKLSFCRINNSADKQKSSPPVGKYFSWTKQSWISPAFYKNMPLPVHEFFPSLVWNEYNALYVGSFAGLFMIYRPSVCPSFRTPTETNPFEQSSNEVNDHSHDQEMP